MASEAPSEWAEQQARDILAAHGRHEVTYFAVQASIARALDTAREQGRCEREVEIVAYLRTWRVRKKGEPDSACLHVERNADEIERGAGRKEDK